MIPLQTHILLQNAEGKLEALVDHLGGLTGSRINLHQVAYPTTK